MKPYPANIRALIGDRFLELGPGCPDEARRPALAALTPEDVTTAPPLVDRDAALCCLAGVWLLHDFHDEAHAIVQDLDTPEASYWHAILHRREPDAGNSKYWFARVGAHPVLAQLAEQAARLGMAYEDPFRFVDTCERVRGTGSPEEATAKRLQRLEWDLLFQYCYQAATGDA